MSPGTSAPDEVRPHTSPDWLRRDATAGGVCMLGITGHLILDRRERAHTRREVRRHVRKLQRQAPPAQRLRVLSGLAPGADIVVTEAALDEARRIGMATQLVVLLPGSVRQLIDDWLARAQQLGEPISAASRASVQRRIELLLAQAWARVDLCQLGAAGADRSQAYRRLAALLAEIPDVLLAVRRSAHAGQAGGTAEIVAWREDPSLIPPELRSPAGSAAAPQRYTFVIDPQPQGSTSALARASAADPLASIRAHLKAGNALSAHDEARALREGGSDDATLRYLLLLSLAATGNAQGALDQYEDLAPPPALRDEDWLSLKGRLYKDLAMAGVEPAANFARAAAEYERAHTRTNGLFSGINAATLQLLNGEQQRAHTLARALLSRQAPAAAANEQARYFHHASRAEAWLVLGEPGSCAEELALANGLLRDDLIARSRTRRQLGLIAQRLGLPGAVAAALEMPQVYLLRDDAQETAPPRLPAALAQRLQGSPVFAVLDDDRPAFASIRRCVEAGARLNLVLPDGRGALLERWRQCTGSEQAGSLEHLLPLAERVSAVRGFLPREAAWCGLEARRLAQGLARVAAASLGVETRALQHGPKGWSIAEEPQMPLARAPAQRKMVGLVFTDVVGFRRFSDSDIEAFWAGVMPALGEEIAAFGDAVLLCATWGDAIHIVTEGAVPAAELSLRLLDGVAAARRRGSGAIAGLQIRVGAHFAPAFEGYDPAERQRTYFGSQLSFAASVEPVTPPGMAYVTEAFAAQLSLEAPARFQLRYAGEIELAKRFGSFRLHALMRA